MRSPVPWQRLFVQVVPVGQSVETAHCGSQLVPTSVLCPFDVKIAWKGWHASLAGSCAKMVYLNVAVPRLKKAPAPSAPMLLLMVTLTSVAVPLSFSSPAPESAVLPYIVTLVRFTASVPQSVGLQSESLRSPPPPFAELPLRVTRFSVAVPWFLLKMPPPKHEVPAQVLLLTVTSVSDRLSLFTIPPPGPLVFCVTTTLLSFSVTKLLVPARPPVWMPPPDASTQVWGCGQSAPVKHICVVVVEHWPPGFP